MRGVRCPHCRAELSEQSVACAMCGAPVDATALATREVPESRWDEHRALLPEGLPPDATVGLEDRLHDTLGRMRTRPWERHWWLLAPVTALRMQAAGLLIPLSAVAAVSCIWLVSGLLGASSSSALGSTMGALVVAAFVGAIVALLVWAIRSEKLTATVWTGVGVVAALAAGAAVLIVWQRLDRGLGESVVTVLSAVAGAASVLCGVATTVWVTSNAYPLLGMFALSGLLWTWVGIRVGGAWVQTRVWRLGVPARRHVPFVLASATLGALTYFVVLVVLGAVALALGRSLADVVGSGSGELPQTVLVGALRDVAPELTLGPVLVAAGSGAAVAFVGFVLLYARGLRTTLPRLLGLRPPSTLYVSDAARTGGRTFMVLAALGTWIYLFVRAGADVYRAADAGFVSPGAVVVAFTVFWAPFLLWVGWDLVAGVILYSMLLFAGAYDGVPVRPDWYDVIVWFVVAAAFVVAGAQAARRLERPTAAAGFWVGAGVGVPPAVVAALFALVNVARVGAVFAAAAVVATLVWAAVFGGTAGAATARAAGRELARAAARRGADVRRGDGSAAAAPPSPPSPPLPG